MKTIFHRAETFRLFFKSAITAVLFLLSFQSYGQLTHVDVTLSLDSSLVTIEDSLIIYERSLIATITPNDLEDLGALSIVVYDGYQQNAVTAEIYKTDEELEAEGAIIDGKIVLKLCRHTPEQTYHIDFAPETHTGAFVIVTTIDYPL